jgi:hypothetical protein
MLAILQAPLIDDVLLDPFSLLHDVVNASEIYISVGPAVISGYLVIATRFL